MLKILVIVCFILGSSFSAFGRGPSCTHQNPDAKAKGYAKKIVANIIPSKEGLKTQLKVRGSAGGSIQEKSD